MPLSPEQIAARKNAIGCSDLGAIAGVNPYRSAFDVWARLSLPVEESAPSQASEWGTALEAFIAEKYARDHGVEIREETKTLIHPEFPRLVGHPDRLIVGQPKGLEIKTAGYRQAHRWGDVEENIIPDEYRIQVAGYCALTGFDEYDLAVLIGGQDYRVYRLTRDHELEAMLISAAREFWTNHVETGIPPSVSDSPAAAEWLKKIYPRNHLPEMQATDAAVKAAIACAEARQLCSSAETVKERTENDLKALIGEAEGFRWGRRSKATWTNNKDGIKTDWETLAREAIAEHDLQPLIEKHTTTKPGARVLRVSLDRE